LSVGGSSDPNAPVDLYADYLDINGVLVPSAGGQPPASWFYKRVWAVASPSANLKEITVTAIVRTPVGRVGPAPQTTIVALKTNPF
jgi:hypothetical protein